MSPRDPAAPPADIAPEHLFAALLEPQPTHPLRARIAGAEDLELVVRALPGLAQASAMWAAARFPAPELRRSRHTLEVLSRCLWTAEGRAFASADEVGMLSGQELRTIAAEALGALATSGPTYAQSDWKAWQEVLSRGARHPANAGAAIALAGCADYGHGAVTFRPDRYWGVPTSQLLDGHWMAYRAARAAWVNDEQPAGGAAAALRRAQMGRG